MTGARSRASGFSLPRRPAKYRAKPTLYQGVSYASKAEAARAAQLDLLVKAGKVSFWIGQPTVRLGVPENVYRPDFLVIAPTLEGPSGGWIAWFEDVKGVETPKFKKDKKLWAAYGPSELRIIRDGNVVEKIPRGDRR